jgi:DNA-binding CsgD family transcriptional regulator
MPNQLMLPSFPDGAARIGDVVSVLSKEGRVTYFLGSDNYFSHREEDAPARRFALAMLMDNGHVRPCDLEKPPFNIPHRTLMNWAAQLREQGSDSFFRARPRQTPRVMTTEKIAECARLIDEGMSISEIAVRVGIGESTLRKAIGRGAVSQKKTRPTRM